MNQFSNLWNNLSSRQKLSISLAVLLTGAALAALVLVPRDKDYRVLYSRLSSEDLAAVTQKLKESKIDFKLGDDGFTVLVPAAGLAPSRLALAASGMPKSGRIGFELFDKSNLTATDFAEHVNFARALEGELERSIQVIEEIERARVHITFPKESVFVESRQAGKASVIVGTRPGRTLSPANVFAITNLVASAVQGLTPEAVAVVDFHGQLLGRPRRNATADDPGPTDAFQEYRVSIEREMQTKLNQALEPVLGDGRFRTGVTVECDFTTKEESEEALDPGRTVMLSEQKTEESSGGGQSSSAGGVPGTASNLPRPPAKPTAQPNTVSRRTQNATYQPTRSVKLVKTPRGQIKRVSVAILVDHEPQMKDKGKQVSLVPPSKEKLTVIRDIASNILGLQENRGDQIAVESLPFDSTLSLVRQPESPAPVDKDANPQGLLKTIWKPDGSLKNTVMQGGALIALFVVCLVGWFVMHKKSKSKVRAVIDARRSIDAGQALETNEDVRVDLQSIPAQIPSGARGMLPSNLTDQIRDEVRKNPRAAAHAVRHMLVAEE